MVSISIKSFTHFNINMYINILSYIICHIYHNLYYFCICQAAIPQPHIKLQSVQPPHRPQVQRTQHNCHEPNKKPAEKKVATPSCNPVIPADLVHACCFQPPGSHRTTSPYISFPQRRTQIKGNPIAYTLNNSKVRTRNHPIHKETKTSDRLRLAQVPCPDQPPLPSADACGASSNLHRLVKCPSRYLHALQSQRLCPSQLHQAVRGRVHCCLQDTLDRL